MELKADLQRLDEYFSAQPTEVLDRGVMHFEPPFDGDYLTTKLWKQFLPGWRERRGRSGDVKMSREAEAKLILEFNEAIDGPEGQPVNIDEADFLAIQRVYPVVMGKWRIIAEDVAKRARAHEKSKIHSQEG